MQCCEVKVWKTLELTSANFQHLWHKLIVIGLVAGSDNGIPVCSGDKLFPGESGKCKSCDNVTRGGSVASWDNTPSLIILEDCLLLQGWEEHYTLSYFTICLLCQIFGILEDFLKFMCTQTFDHFSIRSGWFKMVKHFDFSNGENNYTLMCRLIMW